MGSIAHEMPHLQFTQRTLVKIDSFRWTCQRRQLWGCRGSSILRLDIVSCCGYLAGDRLRWG